MKVGPNWKQTETYFLLCIFGLRVKRNVSQLNNLSYLWSLHPLPAQLDLLLPIALVDK